MINNHSSSEFPGVPVRRRNSGELGGTYLIRVPGWHWRQKLVSCCRALISEMVVPQRGQGCPPLPWTFKKSLISTWMSAPTRSRKVAIAPFKTSCIAS